MFIAAKIVKIEECTGGILQDRHKNPLLVKGRGEDFQYYLSELLL